MKPKTRYILSHFQNFSNSVTGLALYASIAFVLVLYFVPKQTTQKKSPDIWNFIRRSTVSLFSINLDTDIFSSCKQYVWIRC